MTTVQCKICPGSFIWVKTRKGKSQPVDPEPNPEGNITIDAEGYVVVHSGMLRDLVPPDQLWMPHHKTCEDWQRTQGAPAGDLHAYLPRDPTDTQVEAARVARPDSARTRRIVYDALLQRPMCDAELFEVTGLPPNTCRPRRCELAEDGIIVDSGVRRVPPGGRVECIVWKVVRPYEPRVGTR